jgi:hypothetical protein
MSDVLVRGRPNAQQIAGAAGGVKLLEIRRLATKGHAIKIIGERQFWRLAEAAALSRKVTRGSNGTRRARLS